MGKKQMKFKNTDVLPPLLTHDANAQALLVNMILSRFLKLQWKLIYCCE